MAICVVLAVGLLLAVGCALGQLLITIKSILAPEFGVLCWLSNPGWMAAVKAVSLAVVATQALPRQFWRRLWAVDRLAR